MLTAYDLFFEIHTVNLNILNVFGLHKTKKYPENRRFEYIWVRCRKSAWNTTIYFLSLPVSSFELGKESISFSISLFLIYIS